MTPTSIDFPTELLIDHQRVRGEGAVEPILNPATGETLCDVREASAEQLSRATSAAHRAFAS